MDALLLRRAMRVRLALALVLLAATSLRGQSSSYRQIPVRSCPYADSLLGPLKEDARGAVRGFYDRERDSSYLATGVVGRPNPNVMSSTKFAGEGPVREPAIRVTAYFVGRDGQNVAEVSRHGPVQVTFILDDSVTVYQATTLLGRFEADAKVMTQPVSTMLAGKDLLRVVRAQRAVMKVGLPALLLQGAGRDLRALTRVAMCAR